MEEQTESQWTAEQVGAGGEDLQTLVLPQWTLECYMSDMGFWMPICFDSEEVVRARYQWYHEIRPELDAQMRVKDADGNLVEIEYTDPIEDGEPT